MPMPDLEVKTLSEDEYPLWNAFVLNAPQGTFFHQSAWTEIISLATGRPLRIIVCKRGEDILAGLILFDNLKWGLNMATPVPLIPFNGPLLGVMDQAGEHKVIARTLQYSELFVRFLTKYYDFWILDTGFGFHDIRSFQWAGCKLEPVYTYQKKMAAGIELEDTYNQSLRRKIKESEDLGISVKQVDYTEKFLDLYQKSYNRHDINPPVGKAMIKKILTMIIKLPQIKLFVAELENKILAGRVILEDQNAIYDLMAGGDDPTGLGATYTVHTVLSKYAKTEKHFDFMGAGHPGVEQFKRSFGGKLELGFRLTGKVRFPLSFLINMRNANLTRRRKL